MTVAMLKEALGSCIMIFFFFFVCVKVVVYVLVHICEYLCNFFPSVCPFVQDAVIFSSQIRKLLARRAVDLWLWDEYVNMFA